MFVRKKTTASGTVKHYLVECRRVDGKVRQKVLFYLGEYPTPEAFGRAMLPRWDNDIRRWRENAAHYHARGDKQGVEVFEWMVTKLEARRQRLLSLLATRT
jgi:hypothetical protein